MIICIVGPSGIGKTKLSVELAKLVNGGTMYVNCNIIITPIFYLIG